MDDAAMGAEPSVGRGWQQKQFIVTFWCPPPATDENLRRVADEHYNLTWVPEKDLDVAARHRLRAMLTSPLLLPSSLDTPAERDRLDALIDRVKNHPAMEAYFIVDEPGAGAFADLARLVAHLRERDPAHLAYINLFPTYASEAQLGVSADAAARKRVGIPENFAGVGTTDRTVLAYRDYLQKYVKIVKPDLISYDHYHFLKGGNDGKQYFLNLALIREAALASGKPFLNIVQACNLEKAWRLPNLAERRFLAYTTLAYGGRGVSYFVYWYDKGVGALYENAKPSSMAKEVVVLNEEMEKLGPTLLALDSLAVYHTTPLPYGAQAAPADAPIRVTGKGEFVFGLFGKKGGPPAAFMVVNRDYRNAARAEIWIGSAAKAVQEFDRQFGKWGDSRIQVTDQIARIDLAPGDGRLLRVAE